jgi:hypothetical protein
VSEKQLFFYLSPSFPLFFSPPSSFPPLPPQGMRHCINRKIKLLLRVTFPRCLTGDLSREEAGGAWLVRRGVIVVDLCQSLGALGSV